MNPRPLTLLLAAALAGACDIARPFDVDDGGTLEIQVFRGPIFPVQREGDINELPVTFARVSARAAGSDLSRSTVTNSYGLAFISGPPGVWRVTVTDCPGALSRPAEQTATITRGQTRALRFVCDTGIR